MSLLENGTQLHTQSGDIVSTNRLSFAAGTCMILGVFIFNILLALFFNKLRKKLKSNEENMDVDFDAGGQASAGLTATTIVAQWTWSATLLQSSAVASKYGISGPFWYASGATIQILLFSIVSVKMKTHAPGAKTFLQVIRCRFGNRAHKVYIGYALATNLIVTGMLMLGGAKVLQALIVDYSIEMATLMCAVVIGVYTQIGGLGATFYASYFNTLVILTGIIVLFCKIFFAGPSEDFPLGSIENVFALVNSTFGPAENSGQSYITFLSQGGLSFGVINIVGNFGTVFVDQSYYQCFVAAKPKQGVWAFLTGGLVWFAIPFTFATSMGLAYLALSQQQGHCLLTDNEVSSGLLPVAVVSQLNNKIYVIILTLMIVMAVTSTGSAEVMAIASILVYDIHMVYLKAFRAKTEWNQCLLCSGRKQKSGGKLKKDCTCVSMEKCKFCRVDNKERKLIKRGMEPDYSCPTHGKYRLYMDFVKHRKSMCMLASAISTIPIALVLQGLEITLGWVYLSMGILIGSAVIPVTLAITWSSVTPDGMVFGPIFGTLMGVTSWLVVSMTFPGGLTNFFHNTGQELSMLIGNLVSIFGGGLGAVAYSFHGTKTSPQAVDNAWQQTLDIDNPLYPWVDLFRKEFSLPVGSSRPPLAAMTGALRKFFLLALIGSVVLTVLLIFLVPAVASLTGVLNQSEFRIWILISFVWAVLALVYAAVAPVWSELSSIFKTNHVE